MTPEPCPTCKGFCCRNQDFGYRVKHMGAEFYEHVCDDCWDGVQYAPMRSVADERADVVAWLREQQERVEFALTAAGYEHAADAIERGEHVGWSKREGP